MFHHSHARLPLTITSEVDFNCDPTTPAAEHISVYGIEEAIKKTHVSILRNAAQGINSGYTQGHKECYREVARAHGLAVQLERAVLVHDILVSPSLASFILH